MAGSKWMARGLKEEGGRDASLYFDSNSTTFLTLELEIIVEYN